MRAPTGRFWTPEEDEQLIHCFNTTINEGRKVNWNEIAQTLERFGITKSGSSCSQRYKNYLAPGLVHGDFTEEEIDKIKKLMATLGKKWELIASHLKSGRRGNSVKNWYHKQEAKEARELKRAIADGEGPSVGVPLGELNVDDFGQSFLGDLNINVDDFEGFNQPFVNGGDGFGGYDQPFVNGSDDFGGFNQSLADGEGPSVGAPLSDLNVESADGFINGGGASTSGAVDDQDLDTDQYLNFENIDDGFFESYYK